MPADRPGTGTSRPFLQPWLRTFWEMRRQGEVRVRAYTLRIVAELALGPSAADVSPASGTAVGQGPTVKRAGAYTWRDIASLPRELWRRRRRLFDDIRTRPADRTAVVAIAFARLPCSSARSLREQLASLARSLPGTAAPERISAEISAAPRLLVFEAGWLYGCAREHEAFAAEHIYVIDYAMVVCLVATDPLSLLRYLSHRDVRSMIMAGLMRRLHERGVLPAIIFAASYELLLSQCRRLDGYFFTSASFATEILRLVLLHSDGCGRVCELLHGVPTEELEEYFASVLGTSNCEVKHTFVAQVPGLPLYGATAKTETTDRTFAINAAVNHFLEARATGVTLDHWIEHECDWLRQNGYSGRELIVTFAGCGALENDPFDAGVFAAEQAVVRHACEDLRSRGIPFIPLYAPHPMYIGKDFGELPLFSTNRLIICPNTIVTWLVSDAYIALYSSTLFEAAFAGSEVFTPLVGRDRLYPPSLLAGLRHPGEGETWDAALHAFLKSLRPGAGELKQRAAQRAARLTAFADNRSTSGALRADSAATQRIH